MFYQKQQHSGAFSPRIRGCEYRVINIHYINIYYIDNMNIVVLQCREYQNRDIVRLLLD